MLDSFELKPTYPMFRRKPAAESLERWIEFGLVARFAMSILIRPSLTLREDGQKFALTTVHMQEHLQCQLMIPQRLTLTIDGRSLP